MQMLVSKATRLPSSLAAKPVLPTCRAVFRSGAFWTAGAAALAGSAPLLRCGLYRLWQWGVGLVARLRRFFAEIPRRRPSGWNEQRPYGREVVPAAWRLPMAASCGGNAPMPPCVEALGSLAPVSCCGSRATSCPDGIVSSYSACLLRLRRLLTDHGMSMINSVTKHCRQHEACWINVTVQYEPGDDELWSLDHAMQNRRHLRHWRAWGRFPHRRHRIFGFRRHVFRFRHLLWLFPQNGLRRLLDGECRPRTSGKLVFGMHRVRTVIPDWANRCLKASGGVCLHLVQINQVVPFRQTPVSLSGGQR